MEEDEEDDKGEREREEEKIKIGSPPLLLLFCFVDDAFIGP